MLDRGERETILFHPQKVMQSKHCYNHPEFTSRAFKNVYGPTEGTYLAAYNMPNFHYISSQVSAA